MSSRTRDFAYACGFLVFILFLLPLLAVLKDAREYIHEFKSSCVGDVEVFYHKELPYSCKEVSKTYRRD